LSNNIVNIKLFDTPLNGFKTSIGENEFVYIPIYLHMTLNQLKKFYNYDSTLANFIEKLTFVDYLD
jgi:hypothetical protein